MEVIQLRASIAQSSVYFKHGHILSIIPNNTFKLNVLGDPAILQAVGWHPEVRARGYSLPGGQLDLVLQVVTQEGALIETFNKRHSVTVSFITYDFKGRLSLPAITPITMTVDALGDNNEYAIACSLPLTPTWGALSVILDYQDPIIYPLWPIGFPVFLMQGGLAVLGTSLTQGPLTNNVTLRPYLMTSPTDTALNLARFLTVSSLYAEYTAEDAFIATPPRERYNAGEVHQGFYTNCYVAPTIGDTQLSFSPTDGYERLLLASYPTSLKVKSTCPIFAVSGAAISSYSSSYEMGLWVTQLPLEMPLTGPLYSAATYASYDLAPFSMPIHTKLGTLTLSALDYYGVAVDSGLTLSTLVSPTLGDIACVAFDPANPAYASLLSPGVNSSYSFFLRPISPLPLLVGSSVTTQVELMTANTQALVNPLPAWVGPTLELPIYLVRYNGTGWEPYTHIDGVPITVTGGIMTLTNLPVQVATKHQAQPTFLTAPFSPLVVTGTPVQASLP